MTSYSVEPALPEHVVLLPAIELAAARIIPEADLPAEMAAEATSVEVFAEAQRAGQLWVALDPTRRPVGFALVELLEAGPHLEELDVRPDHGRQGLGARLVAAVLDWAGKRGNSVLTLTTFSHLPWNRPYYERLGFRVLDPAEIPPDLARILERERASGLRNRVAMVCPTNSG